MTKRIVTYFVFFLLAATALFLMFKNRKGTLRSDEINFSLEKPWMVDKIEISKKGNIILLEKQQNKWTFNHDYPARNETVNLFLKALGRISIISPASNTILDTITTRLLSEGILLKIFHNGNIIKAFYIYYENKNIPGTYIMDSRMLKPYMVSLIGYSGTNIEKLFSLNPAVWRDKVLFDLKPAEIYSIELIYPLQPDESFKVINQKGKDPLLFSLKSDIPESNASIEDMRDYLSYFISVHYADNDYEIDRNKFSAPFAWLKIISTQQRKFEMKAYRKPMPGGKSYDMNYYYILSEDDTIPLLVKYTETDPIMKTYSDFIKK
jgi:hypothetical protein